MVKHVNSKCVYCAVCVNIFMYEWAMSSVPTDG